MALNHLASGEKRQFGRRQSSAHGWIKVRGRPAIPCLVKNVSSGGAMLELFGPEVLPHRFRIVIDSEGIDSDCEMRHQNGNEIGIELVRYGSRLSATAPGRHR